MEVQANLQNWFSKPILFGHIPEINNDLLAGHAYMLRNREGNESSTWRCTTWNSMKDNPWLEKSETNQELLVLMEHITSVANAFADRLDVDLENHELKLMEFWFNIAGFKDHQEFHVHHGRHISGVYYVKIPEGKSGKFICRTRDSWNQLPLPRKTHVNYPETMEFPPSAGNILLFESDLLHMVEPNETDEDRISISFNYQVIRKQNVHS